MKFPIQLFIWPQSRSVSGRLWFGVFFAYKTIIGRTETRTRDRMYLGRIRSVIYISRYDRARIATCSLRTPTDGFKANYSVDETIIAITTQNLSSNPLTQTPQIKKLKTAHARSIGRKKKFAARPDQWAAGRPDPRAEARPVHNPNRYR